MEQHVEIANRDFWFKVVEMLQQNWALVDQLSDEICRVYFISDTSGVFDEMQFQSIEEASSALKRNGFASYENEEEAKEFIVPPQPPFYRRTHPNGPIYSSGRFWS